MNCNIIKDLLPLYVDACCSEESAKLVAGHLESCSDCREAYRRMGKTCDAQPMEQPKISLRAVSSWKAALLQSVMLFVSFAVVTLGVILEGRTPAGRTNGLWAVALIVPATGYLLSQANCFLVRLYKSRKHFSNGSCIATLAVTVLGYVWALLHYAGNIVLASPLVLCGLGLSAVFCLLSKVLSSRYALLLGKE